MNWPPYKPETLAAVVGVYSLCALIASVVVSTIHGGASPPAYALDSPALFVLERALLASMILVAPAIVVGHMLGGVLPSSIGKNGLNFRQEITGVSREHQELLSGMQEELALLAAQIEAE
jgi:hypothetical protein